MNGVKSTLVCDVQDLELPPSLAAERSFDAAFSNAALHWCKRNPAGVLESLKRALKPGGRFVCEMGGFMNCIGEGHIVCEVSKKYSEDRRREDSITPRGEETRVQSSGDGPLVFPDRGRVPDGKLPETRQIDTRSELVTTDPPNRRVPSRHHVLGAKTDTARRRRSSCMAPALCTQDIFESDQRRGRRGNPGRSRANVRGGLQRSGWKLVDDVCPTAVRGNACCLTVTVRDLRTTHIRAETSRFLPLSVVALNRLACMCTCVSTRTTLQSDTLPIY